MIRQSLPYPQRLPSTGRTAALLLSMTCLALAGCVQTLPKTGNTTASVTSTAPSAQPSSAQPATPNLPLQTRSSALPSWRGEWVGTLDCGKGPVQLKFLLFRQQGSRFGVMGEILSIAGKKPSGVPNFTMVGEETGNQLRMRWERWAHKPLSDRTLNFDGEYVTADNTLSLKPLDSACKPLSMRRQSLEDAAKQQSPQSPPPHPLKTRPTLGRKLLGFPSLRSSPVWAKKEKARSVSSEPRSISDCSQERSPEQKVSFKTPMS